MLCTVCTVVHVYAQFRLLVIVYVLAVSVCCTALCVGSVEVHEHVLVQGVSVRVGIPIATVYMFL